VDADIAAVIDRVKMLEVKLAFGTNFCFFLLSTLWIQQLRS